MKIYISVFYFVFLSCNLSGQNATKLIDNINTQLTKGQTSVSKVLADTSFMFLHSLTEFREVIKHHAKTGAVTMISKTEPGKKIAVRGTINASNGKPLNDALVYVYHTSDKGWYSDTAAHILQNDGDTRHARLFAYLKTDDKGQFEIETIQPKGYPNSDLPAHIHIMVWKNGHLVNGIPGELLFDDDPRLTPERRSRSLGDGYLIEKNSGTLVKPVYSYKIVAKE